jgi:MoxR-like ATPase
LAKVAPKVDQRTLERLISVSMVLRTEGPKNAAVEIPEFPSNLDSIARILNQLPHANPRALLDCLYPYILLPVLEDEQRSVIEATYERFDFNGPEIRIGTSNAAFEQAHVGYIIAGKNSVFGRDVNQWHSKVDIVLEAIPQKNKPSAPQVIISVRGGPHPSSDTEFFVQTEYHSSLLTSMVLSHSVGDLCIIGEKGSGKSAILRALIQLLGYDSEFIPLYKDMSARDLLQRRSTNLSGDTIWENSPLVKAAIEGSIAILDQIEVLSFGTLSSIQQLIQDREISLPDGTLLVKFDKFNKLSQKAGYSPKLLAERRVIPIHPSFRIIAIARPSTSTSLRGSWLSAEIANLFQFIPMRPLSYVEEMEVIQTICPGVPEQQLKDLLKFANMLRTQTDDTVRSLSSALSTRFVFLIPKV